MAEKFLESSSFVDTFVSSFSSQARYYYNKHTPHIKLFIAVYI